MKFSLCLVFFTVQVSSYHRITNGPLWLLSPIINICNHLNMQCRLHKAWNINIWCKIASWLYTWTEKHKFCQFIVYKPVLFSTNLEVGGKEPSYILLRSPGRFLSRQKAYSLLYSYFCILKFWTWCDGDHLTINFIMCANIHFTVQLNLFSMFRENRIFSMLTLKI
jgi:hypothetical protein